MCYQPLGLVFVSHLVTSDEGTLQAWQARQVLGHKPKLLGEATKRPEVKSPAWPRGGSSDKESRLGFNALRRTATYDGTCQLLSTVTPFYFPFCRSP
jgi:hypothetical protein